MDRDSAQGFGSWLANRLEDGLGMPNDPSVAWEAGVEWGRQDASENEEVIDMRELLYKLRDYVRSGEGSPEEFKKKITDLLGMTPKPVPKPAPVYVRPEPPAPKPVPTGRPANWHHFDLWTEGYAANEGWSPANFLGTFPGETFEQAIQLFLATKYDRTLYGDYSEHDGKHYLWGCRIFDKEKDARKNFG